MKKFAIGMVIFALALFLIPLTGAAQDDQNQMSPTPPPVSNPNIHKGVTEYKGTAIYFSTSAEDFDMSAYGAGLEITSGFSERFGWNWVFTMMGLSGEGGGIDLSGIALSAGPSLLFEILQGEQKDAAGEIVKLGIGLTLYAGMSWTVTSMSADIEISDPYLGTYSDTIDMSLSIYDLKAGLVGQIPLGKRLQIVPYGGIVATGGTVTTDGSSESIDSYSYPIYGADIVLRPFRNNPNWKISVGTVLAQISSNDSDNLMIMLGVTYEKGKHYSETMWGPVVR